MIPYNKDLKENSQKLRKQMTKEERHIWYDFLKLLPVAVKRQKCIENYIVDFYIPSAKTVIEIDGGQHKMAENKEIDRQRDDDLTKWGIDVLRYSNIDVNNNFNVVCMDILKHLNLSANELKY